MSSLIGIISIAHLPECVCSLEFNRGRDLLAGVLCLEKIAIIEFHVSCKTSNEDVSHTLY